MLTFDIIHNQKYDFHWPTCVWLFKTFKSSLFQSFIGLKVLMWSPSTIRLKISSFTRTCWWHDYSPRLTTKLVFATIVIYLKVFWREPNSQSTTGLSSNCFKSFWIQEERSVWQSVEKPIYYTFVYILRIIMFKNIYIYFFCFWWSSNLETPI